KASLGMQGIERGKNTPRLFRQRKVGLDGRGDHEGCADVAVSLGLKVVVAVRKRALGRPLANGIVFEDECAFDARRQLDRVRREKSVPGDDDGFGTEL